MRTLLLTTLLAVTALSAQEAYKAKNYDHLLDMKGFTKGALEKHLIIYQRCVTKTNALMSDLRELAEAGKQNTPCWQAIKRRVSWEWDCMRLHEYYFDNMGGDGKPNPDSDLYKMLVAQYGSFDAFLADFKATGALPGSGFVILFQDPYSGKLITDRIDQYPDGPLAGATPIFVMDVWEHAYMWDFGLDIKAYMNVFFNNVDWEVVDKRYAIATSPDQSPPPSLQRTSRQ